MAVKPDKSSNIEKTMILFDVGKDEDINEKIEYINTHECVDSLHLTYFYPYERKCDLSFLKNIKNPLLIKSLGLSNIKVSEEIYQFSEIELLTSDVDDHQIIDLSRFLKLKCLISEKLNMFKNLSLSKVEDLHTNPKIFQGDQISQMKELKHLLLSKATGFSFTKLHDLDKLDDVCFVRCNVKDFKGIEQFPSLTVLNVNYIDSLTSIEGIKHLPNLKRVIFYDCPNIESIDELGELPSLEYLEISGIKNPNIEALGKINSLSKLRLSNCGDISSIKFINDLPNLKWFVFTDTNVLDGDLKPCLRLVYASTNNKKHYNLKSSQLPNKHLED
jgi:hypothetical protein